MKLILGFVFCLFSFLSVTAQKPSLDSIVTVMSDELCNDFTTKHQGKSMSASELQSELLSSLAPVIMKHSQLLSSKYDVDFTDMKSVQGVGEALGFKLSLTCPFFVDAMKGGVQNDVPAIAQQHVPAPNKVPEPSDNITGTTESVIGKLVKVNSEEINSFEIFGDDGKIHTFWILNQITGSEQLYNPGKADKSFEIKYRMQTVFDVKSQTSREVKIAVAVL